MVSPAWNHFSKLSSLKAKCNEPNCDRIVPTQGGSTKGLLSHLKAVHKITYTSNIAKPSKDKDQIEKKTSIPKKAKKVKKEIIKNAGKETLNEILAKCVAKDGFSFKAISNSEAISGFLSYRNLIMPKDYSIFSRCVMDYSNEKKEEISLLLLNFVNLGNKFSITVEQLCSSNFQQYSILTLHCGMNSYSLGLLPVSESDSPNQLINLLTDHLSSFKIDIASNVASISFNLSNYLSSTGPLLPTIGQLCYSYMIHLGVMNVLYQKKTDHTFLSEFSLDDCYPIHSEFLEYSNSSAPLCYYHFSDMNIKFLFQDKPSDFDLIPPYNQIIHETRQMISFFNQDSTRSQVLSKNAALKERESLFLPLDNKANWNSLIPMIKHFLLLKDDLNSVLSEHNMQNIPETNINLLTELLTILEPLELAVLELSKPECHLVLADGIFCYIFKKLSEAQTALSNNILTYIKGVFDKHRNRNVVSLLAYLNSGHFPINNIYFTYSEGNSIKNFAQEIFDRLFTENDKFSPQSNESSSTQNNAFNEIQRLAREICQPSQIPNTDSRSLSNDFDYMEVSGGKKTPRLEKLYQILLNIKPTATEKNRVFSISGNLKTKVTCCLSPEVFDAIIFLKGYFFNKSQ